MRQFIVQNVPDKDGLVKIIGKDYRYLRQVLRVKNGDMLSVRFSDGTLKNTTVCSVDENLKNITLQLCETSGQSVTRGVQAQEVEGHFAQVDYWLFQYIAKPVKMELIIRQAVECGVKHIVPIAGEFSQKQNILAMESGKRERLERIIREARQQSGSPVETIVHPVVTTEQAISMWQEVQQAKGIVLYERNLNSLPLHKVVNGSAVKNAGVVVGCEGGISPSEIELLMKGSFIPVHFDVNILRCETASLYGIAAMQSALLENSVWQLRE